jgi:uncharacterized secreted protein with C-terminal beta-propeller domain
MFPISASPERTASHRRRWVILTAAVAVTLAASPLVAGAATKQTKQTGYRSFSSCEAFLKYVRPIALDQVGPYGFDPYGQYRDFRGGPVPMPEPVGPQPTFPAVAAPVAAEVVAELSSKKSASGGTSTTNTQEAGVDEGDMVETDGRVVYAAIGRFIYVTDALAGKQLAKLEVPVNSFNSELILDGPRLAVITSLSSNVGPESVVSVYNVANPAAPTLIKTTHLEGAAISVRSVDHRARLVLSTSFGQRVAQRFPQITQPISTDAQWKKAVEANKKVIRSAPASEWLPRTYQRNADGTSGPISQALSCGEVGRPRDSSGLGLTWIATIDLDVPNANAAARGSAGVVAQAGTVYASSDTIYVATQKWIRPTPTSRQTNPSQQSTSTEIHAFDMRQADGAAWLASGSFSGSLLNQFSMSEYEGALRIASTRFDAGFGGDSTSGIQTMMLDKSDRRKLITVGQLWGLGTNERIYSVRFVGAQGYVVTFRQTDPLYVLDLSQPRAPKLLGELKIPGYSSYLHPIGDGLLIGVGQNATDQGRVTGAQASLFDVSNPATPTRLATLDLGSQSGAEYDHRAFLWWAETRDLILPTITYPYDRQTGKPQPGGAGALVGRVGNRTSPTMTSRGKVSHDSKIPKPGVPPVPTPSTAPGGTIAPSPAILPAPFYQPLPILRSLIVSGRLVTVSNAGLMTSDLGTLAESSWVGFNLQ